MSTPAIESSKCLKDKLCTRVCPSGTLRDGPLGFPEVATGTTCLSCGHCVSVCPSMAVSLAGSPPEQLEVLAKDWRIEPRRVSQLLKGRRSTRAYRDEPLERSTIEALIQTAQYAPSGHNMQPLSWTVVYERANVRAIAEATIAWMRRSIAQGSPYATAFNMPHYVSQWESGNDQICRNAPHLIVAHAPEQLSSGNHGGAIAITYLEIAAVSLGVGTCWAGYVFIGAAHSPELHAALGLPNGQRCAGAVLLGRAAVAHLRIPARRSPTIHWR